MSGATRDAQLVISAPAKINLFFELLAKRPDGFHDVQTVMTTLSLHDTLTFASMPNSPAIEFRAEWSTGLQTRGQVARPQDPAAQTQDPAIPFFGDLPQDDSNLVVRALRLLQDETGTGHGACVGLTKRIPSGAGLGGGSSNAAAALVAGNLGWNLGLETSHLMRLAGTLGSDVPFFLSQASATGQATALCTGRGECIHRIPQIPSMEIVLVRPPESLGTADVYRRATVSPSQNPLPDRFVKGRIRSAEDLRDCTFNRLQPAAAEMSPWIDRLAHEFSRTTAVAHQMSGSGSTYFGIYKNKHDAKRAGQQLRAARLGHLIRAKTGTTFKVYRVEPSIN